MSSYQRGILTEGETMAEVVEKTPSARSLPLGLVRVLATPQVKRSEMNHKLRESQMFQARLCRDRF
jgi:hypothetical protein